MRPAAASVGDPLICRTPDPIGLQVVTQRLGDGIPDALVVKGNIAIGRRIRNGSIVCDHLHALRTGNFNKPCRSCGILRKLDERVMQLAEEQGYSVNVQASLLRQVRSNIVGMIVPKYDNRYFGDIAEQFEAMARARRFFPVVTCTQRDPELEFEAAKELISYQVECLVSTGATVPDRISAFCGVSGVQSINLDLPGTDAPSVISVISDNYAAARDLTALILDRYKADLG